MLLEKPINWVVIFYGTLTHRSFFSSFCSSERGEAKGFWGDPKPLLVEAPESKGPKGGLSWPLLPPQGVLLEKLDGWMTLEYLWLPAFHPLTVYWIEVPMSLPACACVSSYAPLNCVLQLHPHSVSAWHIHSFPVLSLVLLFAHTHLPGALGLRWELRN